MQNPKGKRTNTGRTHFKKGMPSWNTGKQLSGEHRKKLSESHKGQVPFMTGKKHSPESLKKMSDSHRGHKAWNKGIPHIAVRGSNNVNWRGGITPLNQKIRTSLEYTIWRRGVFERDNYSCIWCGLCSGNGKAVILHADHIKPFCDYPELRFALDNGRTLCIDCHKKTDNFAGKGLTRNKKL